MTLSKPQRGVALGMAAGLVIAVAGLGMTIFLQPFGALAGTLISRLQLLALSALAPTTTLAVSIARLAAHRFRTPQDINGSGFTPGSDQAKLLQALLQNTLEQVALALPIYAAWAVLAPPQLLDAILAAAIMFLIGRILFFWGYARGAPGRAIGFALTFYPTLMLLAAAFVVGVHTASR